MPVPLQLLIVEDSADDTELVLEELIQAGFHPNWTQVDNEVDYLAALDGDPDVIVCDYNMPRFNAPRALELLKSAGLDIPFILVTGSVREETALELACQGATDYFLKDRILRLGQSISQAISGRKLKERTKQLEVLNQTKDDFLSLVAHELRSPISNVKMSLRMMEKTTSDFKRQMYYQLAVKECDREIDLINDLLDLQRLQANKYFLDPQPFSLSALVDKVVTPYQEKAISRQQDLSIVRPEKSSMEFCSDRECLSRVVQELLNNACKYTEPGGKIEFCLKVVRDELQISVRNPATSLPEDLEVLFERFYRFRGGDRWQQGGTGLGLALVKEFVALLQGSISVSGKSGYIEFQMRLPMLAQVASTADGSRQF